MEKIKIGFISVNNATRSILAEAICQDKYSDIFEVYSGGIIPRSHIVCDVSKTLDRNYDLAPVSDPKHINELPKLDIVIYMGDDVDCVLEAKYSENYELLDPMHKLDEIFDLTCKIIELKLEKLVDEIKNNKLEI